MNGTNKKLVLIYFHLQGFVLQPQINFLILRINEAGLFNHWSKQLLKARQISDENDERGIDASYTLKYSDLSTVFLGIVIELFVCFLVFLGEWVVYRFNWRYAAQKKASNEMVLFEYVN